MLIVYKKDTGGIVFTLDDEVDPDRVTCEDDEDVISTILEYGSGIKNLRVDVDTKTLVTKSAIKIRVPTADIYAGEALRVSFDFEGERFGETFPLALGVDAVYDIPYETSDLDITFDLPGEYVLHIPDLRIHSNPVRITVKEDVT